MNKHEALLSFPKGATINATIRLTGSKSESNRALIIAALSKGLIKVDNLSDAADTVTLNQILQRLAKDPFSASPIDVGHAGTAMRFLTAYLSTLEGSFELTGSKRMKERPIKLLVEALWTLGATISYLEENGYPPLQIKGGFKQATDAVQIRGDVSSQYLSALLMIGSSLEKGLSLQIIDDLTSEPYVRMTLTMLEEAGIKHTWTQNVIKIEHQDFSAGRLVVEPDWSAASYWYSIAALVPNAQIALPNLKEHSLQGDSRIQQLMLPLGVETSRTDEGILLRSIGAAEGDSLLQGEDGVENRNTTKDENLLEDETGLIAGEIPSSGIGHTDASVIDLKDCPDLAQTIIVCAAAKGLNLKFTGLETLKIKETNRVKALQNELAKIGVELIEDNFIYTLNCTRLHFPEKVSIKTYDDHRMAMAFAPLSVFVPQLEIEDMDVVEKSYPDFWKDLETAGFKVRSV
jgi:3-phosphoshikimate 1-carboxyvinyltransferase